MTEKQKIRDAVFELVPNLGITYYRRIERKKFLDSRRRAIANEYPLSIEQKEQIDELFVNNYGEKVDYVWHQNYAAHAGSFDYRFFPELLFIPEFEAFENLNRSAVKMMGDKNFLPFIANAVKVNMPMTVVSCTNGILRDIEGCIITPSMAEELVYRESECFVKPTVDTCSGIGCKKIIASEAKFNGRELIVGGGIFNDNYVIQQLVKCHDSINSLYAEAVNTFRVQTYLWKNKIEIMPIIMRIGRDGNYLDNAHAGGLFCAVNEDGTMGKHAITEFNLKFTEHPNTHVTFANHKILYVEKVIKAAIQMHSAVPQVGLFNWDFTIDASGNPVLIEANCMGCSVWLPQMAHGVGAFGEKTAEVLQWLRFMKKMKPQNRYKYVGGYIE